MLEYFNFPSLVYYVLEFYIHDENSDTKLLFFHLWWSYEQWYIQHCAPSEAVNIIEWPVQNQQKWWVCLGIQIKSLHII